MIRLPLGPYVLKHDIVAREMAIGAPLELLGDEIVLSGEVIANVLDDDEDWVDRTGPEPKFLVALTPYGKVRVFTMMSQNEIDIAFMAIKTLTIPKEFCVKVKRKKT